MCSIRSENQTDVRDAAGTGQQDFGQGAEAGAQHPDARYGRRELRRISRTATLGGLFLSFLKIGLVGFGGGLAVIAQIRQLTVRKRGRLTEHEFADATALGQVTPGPVLITATFIGYRVAGTLGALVATVSIFLPAFLMTIAAGSSLRRFRHNELVQSFLRGITPAVVGLLAAAALSIGRAGIHTWVGLSIAVVAAAALVRFRPNAFWVIMGAGVARFLIGLLL